MLFSYFNDFSTIFKNVKYTLKSILQNIKVAINLKLSIESILRENREVIFHICKICL